MLTSQYIFVFVVVARYLRQFYNVERFTKQPFSASKIGDGLRRSSGFGQQLRVRGVERGCEAIQVFNQSPRQWRPTRWKPADVAAFLYANDPEPA